MDYPQTQPVQSDIDEKLPPDEFQIQFAKLPDYAQEWMCSLDAAKNTATIVSKFRLTGKDPLLAEITAEIFFKEISLSSLPEYLMHKLEISQQMSLPLAAELAIRQCLPIRQYFPELESLIIQWGGDESTLSSPAPAFFSAKPKIENAPIILTKTIRQAVQANKEVLNQLLTINPIKIADFNQPVRPTIKNWLSDFVKQKGAIKHEPMARGDYLFNSANAKKLSEKERQRVSAILKSYDTDLPLPFSENKNLILIEKLEDLEKPQNPVSEKIVFQPSAPKVPSAIYPTPKTQAQTPRNDSYREQIAKEDLPNTQKKPDHSPKINGNIIDLKNLNL